MTQAQVRCPGCGALVRAIPGQPHEYIGAAAGCWEIYGQVLAREFGESSSLSTHRLAADTYAAQHPGVPGRKSIQSVNVHLISLHLTLEKSVNGHAATRALGLALEHPERLVWLEPPEPNGRITVVDVAQAGTREEHVRLVKAWARDVWNAWEKHHPVIRSLSPY